MLYLFCPICQRDCDETELSCGGQAHLIRRDHTSSDKDFYRYLYERKNDKGIIFERWRHVYGCGKWFHTARCTVTNQVFGSYSAKDASQIEILIFYQFFLMRHQLNYFHK